MTPIAAVVVLYNPTLDFIDNIHQYINCLESLIIVDNTRSPSIVLLESLSSDPRVKIIYNKENKGIASAVNQGVEIAAANNYSWLLLMDQDSFFEKRMLEKYIYELDEIIKTNTPAVAGPLYETNTGTTSRVTQANSLITSGSIVNIPIFRKLGGYNESLFIDEVDHEYCYRARIAGHSIIQLGNIFLNHSLGKERTITTVAGKKKNKAFHSPTRLYYMVRNCCYVISKYKSKFPKEMQNKRKDLLVRIKNHLLYAPKKLSSIKHIWLGFKHFKKNRFGQL